MKPPRDGCAGHKDHNGDFDCGYDTIIDCEDCIYTEHGRKNPQAKRNQHEAKEDDSLKDHFRDVWEQYYNQ